MLLASSRQRLIKVQSGSEIKIIECGQVLRVHEIRKQLKWENKMLCSEEDKKDDKHRKSVTKEAKVLETSGQPGKTYRQTLKTLAEL